MGKSAVPEIGVYLLPGDVLPLPQSSHDRRLIGITGTEEWQLAALTVEQPRVTWSNSSLTGAAHKRTPTHPDPNRNRTPKHLASARDLPLPSEKLKRHASGFRTIIPLAVKADLGKRGNAAGRAERRRKLQTCMVSSVTVLVCPRGLERQSKRGKDNS